MTGTNELRPEPEPEIASVPGPLRMLSRRSGLSDVLGMLIVLGGLAILFGLLSKHFWTGQTVKIIVNQIADLTVVSVGMTFVLVIGGIDLSVGSVLALAGTVLGIALVDWHWPFWLAFAGCLAVAGTCGLVNGLVSVLWSIPSFIVTLGMLEMARGAAYLVTELGNQVHRTSDRVDCPAACRTGNLPGLPDRAGAGLAWSAAADANDARAGT